MTHDPYQVLAHPGARCVTPLTEGRPNYAGGVAGIARAMGKPPMPWQQHAAALATEQLPDGRWAYDELITTVQRRAGKTTLRVPMAWHRALLKPGSRLWLTAQTRQDARDILVDETDPLVKQLPHFIRSRAKLRRSQGSEGWHFTNGSTWRVFATGESALHGKASEVVDVDEGWSFSLLEGSALTQAIAPTQLTTGGQFSAFSTMGTSNSLWFHGKVDAARAANTAGAREGTAIIDLGIPDELRDQVRAWLEAGPDTPDWDRAIEALAAHHPAYGHTITRLGAFSSVARSILAADHGGGPDGVLRALGNVPTETAEAVIPWGGWTALKVDTWPKPAGVPRLAVTVGRNREDAAITAAWLVDGRVHVDVIKWQPGADWVPDTVDELAPTWGRPPIAGDRVGPGVDVLAELERRGHHVETPTTTQYATACQGILDAATDASRGESLRLAHRGQDELDDAVKAAGVRPLSDAGWAWSRLRSSASIATLEGITLARWALLSVPIVGKPTLTTEAAK